MHIVRCKGSKFCVKFQRTPLKFHTKFWIHTPHSVFYFCVLVTINLSWADKSLRETGSCRYIDDPVRLTYQNGCQFADHTFQTHFFSERKCYNFDSNFTENYSYGSTHSKSALVQVMAGYHTKQATNRYLIQCWPSLLTYICGIRWSWVKGLPSI